MLRSLSAKVWLMNSDTVPLVVVSDGPCVDILHGHTRVHTERENLMYTASPCNKAIERLAQERKGACLLLVRPQHP